MPPWFIDYEVCENTRSALLFAFSRSNNPCGQIDLHCDFIRGTQSLVRGLEEAMRQGSSEVALTIPELPEYGFEGYPDIWMPDRVDGVVSGRDYRIIKTLRMHRLPDSPMRRIKDEAFIVKTDDCDLADSLVIRANLQRAGLADAQNCPSELLRGLNDVEVSARIADKMLLPEKHRGNTFLLRDVGLMLWNHVPFRASLELTEKWELEMYADTRAMENLRDEWDRHWPDGDGKLRYFNEGPPTPRRPFLMTRYGPKTNTVVSHLYMLTEGPMNEDPGAEFAAWMRAPRRPCDDGKYDVVVR